MSNSEKHQRFYQKSLTEEIDKIEIIEAVSSSAADEFTVEGTLTITLHFE